MQRGADLVEHRSRGWSRPDGGWPRPAGRRRQQRGGHAAREPAGPGRGRHAGRSVGMVSTMTDMGCSDERMSRVPLTTTRRTGLVDQVIEQMRQAIRTGDWAVDQRIPPEPELVTALGVGRNTVREAVRALSHAGPAGGPAGRRHVRPRDQRDLRRAAPDCAARSCARSARSGGYWRSRARGWRRPTAPRPNWPRWLTALAERNAAVAAGSWRTRVDADARFHQGVVRRSGNGLLTELYQGLTEMVRASLATTAGPTTRPGASGTRRCWPRSATGTGQAAHEADGS